MCHRISKRKNRAFLIVPGFALLLAVVAMAGVPSTASQSYRAAAIIYGESASRTEKHAAQELAKDLARVYGFSPEVLSAASWKAGSADKDKAVFYVGLADTNSLINKFASQGIIQVSYSDPGPEAFVIKTLPASGLAIIAGCDDRGTLYGVYEFSQRALGIDPMEFWTGKAPPRRDALEMPDLSVREKPPAFPLRGYFDNDSDMLANYSGKKLIIEFETWKEMLDSLARLRYNYIDPFDTLGRTEFWVWPYYQKMFPGYHTDLELVEKIIDYAHEKGMMVQVSTYLGYEFHHLDYEQKCLSRHHDDWMAAYRYLLEKTPVGKADIFLHSPRDPWWDRAYRCPSERLMGIEPGPLHTAVINELNAMIKEHNPKAILLCNLWSDGKNDWNRDKFRPDVSIPMVWSDNGYAQYPSWPDDFKGHPFGIYIHAGFWKNHVIQDPYPERIREATLEAFKRGMTADYFVNGQDFKHFILNLEACGRAAWDPQAFDADAFYTEWATRYFGPEAAAKTVESLRALHRSSERAGGFAQVTMNTKLALRLMHSGVPYCRDCSYLDPALTEARKALALAQEAETLVPEGSRLVFRDQIIFPAEIYLANLELHQSVVRVASVRCLLSDPLASPDEKIKAWREAPEFKKKAPAQLARLREMLEQGSGWDKWNGWTKPENFRKYEPPPTQDELKSSLKMF